MHVQHYVSQWVKSVAVAIFGHDPRPLGFRDTLPDQPPPSFDDAERDTLPDFAPPDVASGTLPSSVSARPEPLVPSAPIDPPRK